MLTGGITVHAQSPDRHYYYSPRTTLPWAHCSVVFRSGSEMKIPFLPVINCFAPTGTMHYTQDIDIDCPIVFAAAGAVNDTSNCYRNVSVAGNAVMLFYDFPNAAPDSRTRFTNIHTRLRNALDRNVAAVILCSYHDENPFLSFQYEDLETGAAVPIITVNREGASDILLAAGENPSLIFTDWENGTSPQSKELICRLRLHAEGTFAQIETEYGSFFYRKGAIAEDTLSALAAMQNRSITFLLNLFREASPHWRKVPSVYFADYDSKFFYTRHRGHAGSRPSGNYYVFRSSYGTLAADPYGLIVHENTHLLFFHNWLQDCYGTSSSFLFEGTAMYAQAMATDKKVNHQKTLAYAKAGKLFPLSEMLTFNIGVTGLKTEVGYPASGSLVQYLIETYGLNRFMKFWRSGDWQASFAKSMHTIEKEWIDWLQTHAS